MTQRWKGGKKKDRGRDIVVRGLEGRERERERERERGHSGCFESVEALAKSQVLSARKAFQRIWLASL